MPDQRVHEDLDQTDAEGKKLSGACHKREYLMIIFPFLIKTIRSDLSSEPSHRDGSDKGSQCCFMQI